MFFRRKRPREDSRYLFFIEEAYDGFTVPKNLIKQSKLDSIKQSFQEARDRFLMDLVGGIPMHLMFQNKIIADYEINNIEEEINL